MAHGMGKGAENAWGSLLHFSKQCKILLSVDDGNLKLVASSRDPDIDIIGFEFEYEALGLG